ncbi:MAG: ribonuclease PH [Anaerolineales bacterium]|nr:ribonuclease PH [Anaerolineales bacterium]
MVNQRKDGRAPDEMRAIRVTPDFVMYPEGSVLIAFGNTRVLCNVTVEQTVPRWMKEQNQRGGWVTAEYALLPRSTLQRTARETAGLRGRTQEIRRLIGRSLRAALDLEKLDGYTCIIDCDVLQADGGTRTASISGAYIALVKALNPLIAAGKLPSGVIQEQVAAVSVGMIGGVPMLDLNYIEDAAADVDLNVVMNSKHEYIEVQGTAEGHSFDRDSLEMMLDLAEKGMLAIFAHQKAILEI